MLQCNNGRSNPNQASPRQLVVIPSDLGSLQTEEEVFAMDTLRTNQTTSNFDSMVAGGAGRALGRLGGGLVLWARRLRSKQKLARLSDRALADIGTTRADLPGFAKERDPWRSLTKEAALVLALGALIERAEGWYARRRRQARVYREMMAYSDRDLDELGVDRRDIPKIARSA
jgi:uncharacterized protein YjiS (DUF1127 family)